MGIEFEAVQKVIWSMVKALPTTISLSLLVLFFSMIIAVIMMLLMMAVRRIEIHNQGGKGAKA